MYINIVANVLHLHLQLQQNINGNKYNFKNIIIPLSYHSFSNRKSIIGFYEIQRNSVVDYIILLALYRTTYFIMFVIIYSFAALYFIPCVTS